MIKTKDTMAAPPGHGIIDFGKLAADIIGDDVPTTELAKLSEHDRSLLLAQATGRIKAINHLATAIANVAVAMDNRTALLAAKAGLKFEPVP